MVLYAEKSFLSTAEEGGRHASTKENTRWAKRRNVTGLIPHVITAPASWQLNGFWLLFCVAVPIVICGGL